MKWTCSVLLFSLLAAGCTTLVPGTSREVDVTSYFGKPTEERKLADGGRELEFPRSPLGYENWRVTLGPDGVVRNVEQLLDEPHFKQLKPGMTMDEVKHVLGRPGDYAKYPNLSEEVLSWRYMEFSVRMFFNAHFDGAGRFKYSSRLEEPRPIGDDISM